MSLRASWKPTRDGGMTELREALEEISAIRSQVARWTQFRGYGPGSTAATGLLAFLAATVQSVWLKDASHDFLIFLCIWVAAAALSVLLAAIEMTARARRVHCEFAQEMIYSAVEQFLPAIIVGLLLTVVLMRVAAHDLWMLPGLWEIIFSLGVFASCRFLPRQMFAVGIWYLASGLTCLIIAAGNRTLSPWAMGIPFGVGQLLVAAVLQFGFEDTLEEK
jgi:hypothetical protein